MSSLPKSFQAIRCSKPNGPWEVVTVPLRDPTPNEVLIRVHASGICSSDHIVKTGYWPGFQYPRTPGHEVVGRIARIGSGLKDVERFKLGALVGAGWNGGYCNTCEYCREGETWACKYGQNTGITFDGGHAEYMFAPESAIVTLSEEWLQKSSYAELAPLLCAGTTVYDAIRTTKWAPGDICLVQGIGGLGHLAIQYAAKMGLKVYAVSSGAAKKDLAFSLGAYGYIDASKTDAIAEIQRLGGARIIVCTAPQADHITKIIPAVSKNGTVTLLSVVGDKNVEISTVTMILNRATVRGWLCGSSSGTEKCLNYSDLAGIKPIVETFSLTDFDKAWVSMEDGSARFRNVIVFP